MMEYEVTIGIPVDNVEKYIRMAIESALGQTFKSIEFLICDDCGTDTSMDIVRYYQRNHPRGKDMRIVRQPQNMKLGAARNRIIKEARGKYLFHLDADDEIYPNTIELLYNALRQYDAQIVYGSSEWIYVETGGKVESHVYPSMHFLSEDDFANWAYRTYDGIQANTWNFLIDVDVYRKNGIMHQPINFWEDFTVTMDLPTYISKAVLLPNITYKYYLRNGSLSNFQKRKVIAKDEIVKTIDAIRAVKNNSERIRSKSYYPKRSYKLMLTCFFMACAILRNEQLIVPSFTNSEIRDMMASPLSFRQICQFKEWRLKNLCMYLVGVLPADFAVWLIKMIGKKKGIV